MQQNFSFVWQLPMHGAKKFFFSPFGMPLSGTVHGPCMMHKMYTPHTVHKIFPMSPVLVPRSFVLSFSWVGGSEASLSLASVSGVNLVRLERTEYKFLEEVASQIVNNNMHLPPKDLFKQRFKV